MLFWTRSFLCIGTVVALATGWSPGHSLSLPAESSTMDAAQIGDAVMRLCKAAPRDCAEALQNGLGRASIIQPLQAEGLSAAQRGSVTVERSEPEGSPPLSRPLRLRAARLHVGP